MITNIFEFKLEESNEIIISEDLTTNMAKLELNDKFIIESPFMDFYPMINGGWFLVISKLYGGFHTHDELAESIKNYIIDKGKKVQIKKINYKYI